MAEGELYLIAKLIWDYKSIGKEIDKDYVERVVEIVKNARNLQNFIKYVQFTDRKDTIWGLASYEAAWKMLHVNLNKTKKEQDLTYSKTNMDFENKKMGYYLENTKDLLHALEHAEQCKRCMEKEKSMEARILDISYNQIFGRWERFRENHYTSKLLVDLTKVYSMRHITIHNAYRSIAPFERLAEIKAIEDEETLADVLDYPVLTDYASYKKLEMNYLAHYFYKVPTIYYLNQHGIYKRADKILEEGRYLDFESRLALGLYISKEEKQNTEQELIKLRSRWKRGVQNAR